MNSEAGDLHLQILGIGPDATPVEIKKAYRRLAHRYHPDKSAPESLKINTEIMIRLNEAYRRAFHEALQRQKNALHAVKITAQPPSHGKTGAASPGAQPRHAPAEPMKSPSPPASSCGKAGHAEPDIQAPALPKDPAYACYKQGHLYFHRGFYKFYRKKTVIENKLQAALEILNNFRKAYEYYNKVVDEYPESPWCADARFKIKKIKKLTPIYRKIFERLRELNDEELRKLKTWEEVTRRNGFCSVKDLERTFLHIWEVKKI